MNFNPNSSFLFTAVTLVILFVVAQSVFFLVRSYKRAKEVKMDMKVIHKTLISSALFTLVPAVGILLGLVTLSKFLGLPLPWLRLSIIGAITYELPAATSTASALGVSLSETIKDPKVYSAIAWVMTLGIMPSTVLVPILLERIQKGILSVKEKDSKWGDIFITALFLGMIASFLGMIFSNVRSGLVGWIPVFVLLFSSLVMGICGLMVKVFKMNWLQNYALPISMLSAMAFAVGITPLIV